MGGASDPVDTAFLTRLPKIELHAHLHGSVRRTTLLELCRAADESNARATATDSQNSHQAPDPQNSHRTQNQASSTSSPSLASRCAGLLSGTLDVGACFSLFPIVHAAVRSLGDVRRIAYETAWDYAAESCAYMELRTTPRAIGGCGTPREAVTAIAQVMALCGCVEGLPEVSPVPEWWGKAAWRDREREKGWKPKMRAALLLSINRGTMNAADAMGVVDLARSLRESDGGLWSQFYVGVELSGDPRRGHFSTFAPAFKAARAAGMITPLHFGEVAGTAAEQGAMLDSFSDAEIGLVRLGHCIHLCEPHRSQVIARSVPVEICVTSNVDCGAVASDEAHHVSLHIASGAPICLCTDDRGVFGTTLSNEYARVCSAAGMGRQECFDVAASGLRCVPHIGDAAWEALAGVWRSFAQREGLSAQAVPASRVTSRA